MKEFEEYFNVVCVKEDRKTCNFIQNVDQQIDDLFSNDNLNVRSNSHCSGPVNNNHFKKSNHVQWIDPKYKLKISPEFFRRNNSDPIRMCTNNEEFTEIEVPNRVITFGSGNYSFIQAWVGHINANRI